MKRSFAEYLDEVLAELRTMLLEKNRRYGNSALEPMRVFSQAPRREQIWVRMDDKLSRIAQGSATPDSENPRVDLVGYGIIDMIAEKIEKEESNG